MTPAALLLWPDPFGLYREDERLLVRAMGATGGDPAAAEALLERAQALAEVNRFGIQEALNRLLWKDNQEMNMDTGEMMPIDPATLARLKQDGHQVTEPEPGHLVVLLPDSVYRAEQARSQAAGKARRRAIRKQADRTRRGQRGGK